MYIISILIMSNKGTKIPTVKKPATKTTEKVVEKKTVTKIAVKKAAPKVVTKIAEKKVAPKHKYGKCDICSTSFANVSQGNNGCCVKCDTTPNGTWVLSYLAQQDLIENDDTIENGYSVCSAMNGFLGLEDGVEIMCQVDKYDKNLFHALCDVNAYGAKNKKHFCTEDESSTDGECGKSYEWNSEDENDDRISDGGPFWEKPDIVKIDFRVSMNIEVLNKK
jgi:hypothetical protein